MATTTHTRTVHDRFQRFMAWYVVVLGGFAILLLAMVVLIAFAFGGDLHLYVDKFGEARVEVLLFAVVVGTVPFALYSLDELLRSVE